MSLAVGKHGDGVNYVAAIDQSDPKLRAEEYRAQLDRIISCPNFQATQREQQFLAYIVNEAISGRSRGIKAYSIAIEVLGRDASFDPQNDPIVRILAAHLRRTLERYYLTEGKTDPVVITVPKGSYIPTFQSNPQVLRVAAPKNEPLTATSTVNAVASRWLWPTMLAGFGAAALIVFTVFTFLPGTGPPPGSPEVPRVQVMQLEDLARSGSSSLIADGLTQEIVAQLAKFRDIVVVQAAYGGATLKPPPRFILAGSVDISKDAFHLRVRLINREDGSILWANTFEGAHKTSNIVKVQSDIAQNVATSLAQTYGVIFQADISRVTGQPPDDWAAYSCTLSYYAYRMSMDHTLQAKVRQCLETSVERFPKYSTAWALLAQMQLEQVRFTVPYDPAKAQPAIDKALANARHASEIDPLNVRALQAQMFALFFSGQFEAGRQVGEKALQLNPNDTELRGEYGYRLALSGDWERGCTLLRTARETNPGANGYYESGLALCSFFDRESENAAMWIEKTPVPNNAFYHLIAAAVFGKEGLAAKGRKELKWLCVNRPVLIQNLTGEVSARLGRKEDVRLFLGALEKTGVKVSSHAGICSALESIDPT